MRYLFLALLLTLSTLLFSQRNTTKFVDAELFLNTGEVIMGEIKIKAEYKKKIVFKPEGSKKKVKYPIRLIKSMRVNLIRYGKVTIFGKTKLLEKVAFGHYTLYAYDKHLENRVQRHYYLQTKKDLYYVDNHNLKGIIKIHFNEFPRLNEIEWTLDKFPSLVRKYNQLKTRQEKSGAED